MTTIIAIAKKITIDYIFGKTTIVILDLMLIRRPSELGAIIATARRARGLTQGALADRLGVSRVWLGQIERGKSSARIDMVFRVLNELDVALSADIGEPSTPESSTASGPSVFDIDAIADTGLVRQTRPVGGAVGKKRARK